MAQANEPRRRVVLGRVLERTAVNTIDRHARVVAPPAGCAELDARALLDQGLWFGCAWRITRRLAGVIDRREVA